MTQPEITKHYEEEKSRLNAEQRHAVESIEGPVIVLAGPGTGKTQVLAFRIAEILRKSDVSPRNILALTFTESGVTAMRERLVSLIGVAAFGVAIYTFHSFANRVINDSGAEFYKSHTLDPIDDIAQLKCIIRLIDALNNELLRPTRAPHFYVKPVMQAIKQLKNEGISPEQLRDLCKEEITSLENNPESISKSGKNKGELKQSVKNTIEKLQRSQVLADIYAGYEKELETSGLYDYEDMILFVITSFQTNRDLLAKYQEQYQYILVDEYQDTNNAQNTLVRLLSDYFENPNVFVVGDDKQSIYRFQGASMANLLNFHEWYPKAELISLQQNYRSGQNILDNAHALIHNNHEQLTQVLPHIHDELFAQSKAGDVQYVTYPSTDDEVVGVINKIKELLEKGISASEIAIIYRENSEAEEFADLLTRQGIPFHLEAGNDVYKDQDVRHLINLLDLALNPDNEAALFRYIYSPYSGVDSADLVTLSRFRKSERTNWQVLLNGDEPETTVPLKDWAQLKMCKAKIDAWHRYQATHNLGDTVEFIFADSGLLAFIIRQANHLERLHRLRCLFDDLKHITRSVNFATLQDFFERYAIRQTYNLSLTCLPLAQRRDQAVRLMTAHKSKGLEFQSVFIPHFCDGRWSNGGKREILRLPVGIIHHHHTTDDQAIEEERRLFYVALTRAKHSVYLSSSEIDEANKKLLPCQFLSELPNVTLSLPISNGEVSLTGFFSTIEPKFVEETSRDYLKEIVSQQPITPTGLNTFLVCPQEYLYRDVYCIPGVREPYQAYGTAIHKALELWGNWSKQSSEGFGLNSILSVFTETLVKEGLNEDEVNRYKKLGVDVLAAYYELKASEWVPPLAMEYSFTPHTVMLDGKIPLTGKLDKIEPIKGSKFVRVVDYKTGRVRSRNDIEGKTASGDMDYMRQLIFYTVLAEADPFFPYTVGEVSLAFIDDQKRFTTETFEISKQQKDDLRGLIRSVYSEITALHFHHTPHKKRYGIGESLCELLRIDVSPLTLPFSSESATQPSQ